MTNKKKDTAASQAETAVAAEEAKVDPSRRDMNTPSSIAEAERNGVDDGEVTDPLNGAIIAGGEGPTRFTSADPEMDSMTKTDEGASGEDIPLTAAERKAGE